MKGVFLCFLIFLNFAVVLCSQDEAQDQRTTRGICSSRPKAGSGPVWDSLVKGTEPILLDGNDCGSANMELQESLPVKVTFGKGTINFPSHEVIVRKYCRIELDERAKMISILPKLAPEKGQPNNQDEAVFLPFVPDSITFMLLPAKEGIWFFTARLTGCDVFVATDENSNVLVLHGNTNEVFEKEGELVSVQVKGEAADQIIESKGYTLKARVYHAPTLPDTAQYLEKYHKEHGLVERWTYDNVKAGDTFLFFGYYDNKVWQFYLKSENGGAVQIIRIAN